MRTGPLVLIALSAAFAAIGPASAARLVMPDNNPAPYAAYASKAIEQPWSPQRPEMELHEQPFGELIAARLGFAQGSAELFRYRLENAPSTRTQLDGMIDGGGIKLKLTW
ncbi:MAG TPA: hypothetical protein VII56_23810 [Rhizomicrobium sp.]